MTCQTAATRDLYDPNVGQNRAWNISREFHILHPVALTVKVNAFVVVVTKRDTQSDVIIVVRSKCSKDQTFTVRKPEE